MATEKTNDRVAASGRRVRDGSHFEELAAYSRAARHGPFVAVSGTGALDANGNALFPGDTYAQTTEALRRALKAVQAAGGDIRDVIRTRLYLAHEASWQEAARAHGEQFRGYDPASTILFVTGFPPTGVLVEAEIDAIVTD